MGLRTKLAELPAEAFSNDGVFFRPIQTEEDLIYALLDCRLREDQQDLVNPAAFSIGRAYLKPEDNVPCVICSRKGEPVGFISLVRWLGSGDAWSWSYYIDRDRQGKGYGRKAAELAAALLKQADGGKTIKLAAEESNGRARRLYLSLGFTLQEERDGDDLVYAL